MRGRLQKVMCGCLAIVAIALAGCGGSKSGAESASTTQPPPPSKNVVDATQGRLGKALLTKEAAGPGWTIAKPRDVAPTQLYCNRAFAGGLQPYAQAQAAFRQRYGSAITQDIWAYADDGAQRVIDDFRTIVKSCPTWSSSPEVGRTVKYFVKPLNFPKIGDDTVAGRMRLSNQFGGLDVEHSVILIMVRRANLIDFITQSANTGLFQPKSQTEALVRKADRVLVSTR